MTARRSSKSLKGVNAPPPEPVPEPSDNHDEYGILQFEPDTCTSPPKFTEKFTIDAMGKCGIVPEDLVKLSSQQIARIPGKADIKNRIIQELETRRMTFIENIKAAREELIKAEENRQRIIRQYTSRTARSMEEHEIERAQKMQKREIEQLITVELKKKKMREKEIEKQNKLQQKIKAQEEAKVKKIAEENAKRKRKEEMVIERINKKEAELQLQRQKQEEEEEKRKKAEEETKEQKRIEAAQLEQKRQKRLLKLQEEQKRKQKEIEEKRSQQEEIIQKREEARLKSRQDELNALKEKHRELMEKQQQRLSLSQKKEKERVESRLKKIQEDEKNLQARMIECKRKKEAQILAMKRRNDDKLKKSRDFAHKLEQDQKMKRKEYEKKNSLIAERIERIIVEKNRKKESALRGDSQRASKANEIRQRSSELMEQKIGSSLKKLELSEQRIASMRQKAEEESQAKAAEQWLKLKLGEDNAKRLERRKEWEKQQTLKKIEEKSMSVKLMNEHKKNEALRRKKQSDLLAMKKHDLIAEFQNLVQSGGTPDLHKLAKQFDLDLEELERRVNDEQRKPLSELFSHSQETDEEQ